MRYRLIPAILLMSACGGVGPDDMTGGDGGRGDAKEVALDTLLYDRVSVDQGDSTDWKKFEIEETTKATIKVWWDDPKAVSARIEIRDQAGDKISDLKHEKGESAEKLGPVKLKDGTYFLRVSAGAGASVYSYEISTGSGEDGGGGPDL